MTKDVHFSHPCFYLISMQSVPITNNVMSSDPAQARCTDKTLCDKVCQRHLQVGSFLFRFSAPINTITLTPIA